MDIPDDVLAEIYLHAREEFPNECCGWLTGPKEADHVDRVRRAVNAYRPESHPTASDRTPETAYVIDGADLIDLYRSLDGAEPPRIIYHSHPNGRAYFSPTDQKVAADPWGDGPAYPVRHLVVGIDADRVVESRLHDWDDDEKRYVETARFDGADV